MTREERFAAVTSKFVNNQTSVTGQPPKNEPAKAPDPVQDFLEKIGPRELTDQEARQLHLLKIRAGKAKGATTSDRPPAPSIPPEMPKIPK